ncbi:MAG: hypothetical protein Q8K10_00685 [Methylobacter sp.]|nr:hypothetical protein [Methylobacter sp.]
MLEILASNRDMNINIQEAFKMLQIEIEKLPSFVMGQEHGIEQGMEKGMAMGEKKRALLIARNLIKDDFSLEKIAQITGLDLTDLEKLAQE